MTRYEDFKIRIDFDVDKIVGFDLCEGKGKTIYLANGAPAAVEIALRAVGDALAAYLKLRTL